MFSLQIKKFFFILYDQLNLMIKSTRYCVIKGHEIYSTSHICIHPGCINKTRWVCTECMIQQIHSHRQNSQNYIISEQQFKEKFKSGLSFLQRDLQNEQDITKEYIRQCHKIIQKTSKFLDILKNNQEQKQLREIQKQLKLINSDFLSIENQQLGFNLDLTYRQMRIDKSNQLLENISLIIEDFNELKNLINQNLEQINICSQLQNRNDQAQKNNLDKNSQELLKNDLKFKDQINFKSEEDIYTASISKNQNYLIFGGKDQQLMIYDLKQSIKLQEIKLNYQIYVCQFSQDSRFIYVGCSEGFLYCIEQFKIVYERQIHEDVITNIIEKQDNILITCSLDQSIIITDVNSDQKLLIIIDFHDDWISGLEYNHEQDLIFSACQNKLQLFDAMSGIKLREQENAHHETIYQIQLIDKNSKLLSLSIDGVLILWGIDYQKGLFKINQLKEQNKIYNFTSICNRYIILIYKQQVKIVDENFNIIQTIAHTQGDDIFYRKIKQAEFLNHIILLGKQQITVMKQQQNQK
ncbi:WD repeat-containing protein 49 [Paramecium bursaria]